jgi:hypothetical protein
MPVPLQPGTATTVVSADTKAVARPGIERRVCKRRLIVSTLAFAGVSSISVMTTGVATGRPTL